MSNHRITLIRQADAHIDALDPVMIVEQAIHTCRDMVASASKEISDIRLAGGEAGEGMDKVKEAYFNSEGKSFPIWFGWHERNPDRALKRIETRFNEIIQRIDKGLNIRCRPATGRRSGRCDKDGFAYQVGGSIRARKFHLCPKWFNKEFEDGGHALKLDNNVYRASIIAHEICHAVGGLGTRDQRLAPCVKVYNENKALAFAANEPLKAAKSPENVEQFLVYRERVRQKPESFIRMPKADDTPPLQWTGVPANPDTAVHHPNGNIYFFKGDRYWRYNPTTFQVDKANARIGIDGWAGVPHNLDAALLHPSNGKIYFFKGDCYYRYVPGVGIDHDDTRKIGEYGWAGVTPNIDAAIMSKNKSHALFFYGPYYRTFSFGSGRAGALMHIRDTRKWGQFDYLYGSFDAALMNEQTGHGTFFTGDHYQMDDMAGYNTHFGS